MRLVGFPALVLRSFAGLVLCALAAPSRADTLAVARGTLSAGATNNALASTEALQAALITTARLGGRLEHTSDGASQAVSYGVMLRISSDIESASFVNQHASGSATWELGRAFTWSLSGAGTLGRMSELDPLLAAELRARAQLPGAGSNAGAPPSMELPQPGAPSDSFAAGRPIGQVRFISGGANESLGWDSGRFWSARQVGSASTFRPLEDAPNVRSSVLAQHVFTVDRRLWRGAIGLWQRVGHLRSEALVVPGFTPIPQVRETYGEALLGWTHELSPTWTAYVAAGAYGNWLRVEDRLHVGPGGRARLVHQFDEGMAVSLQVARTMVPNVLLGYVLRSDVVSLQGVRPLDPAQRLTLGGSANYVRGRQINERGGVEGLLEIASLVASLRYDPAGPLRYGVDMVAYQQGGDPTRTLVVQDLRQIVVLGLLEVTWPSHDTYGRMTN